jgi:hypothetical protein
MKSLHGQAGLQKQRGAQPQPLWAACEIEGFNTVDPGKGGGESIVGLPWK